MATFKIGQKVRYGQSGVCEIRELASMDGAAYYVLSPLFRQGATVYVPSENADLVARMQPLLTPDEIPALLDRAEKAQPEWNRDFRKRSEESRQALASPDRLDALVLIKSIYAHKKEMSGLGKRAHTTDDYFLRDAELLIYHEIAYVLDEPFEAVTARVRAMLGANR